MLRYLFVDFNAYFASVEQQARPELRGKPVGVVPTLVDSTSCIAASYEAKRMGVKTGTLVRDAKQLCPGIQLVEARPYLYVEYHHRLVRAVEQCLHVEKVMSIDEMACELTGSKRIRQNAIDTAAEIKRSIAAGVGDYIKCSIGIAPNVFLAKTATDMQKPDGCTILDSDDIPDKLYALALTDLCGIGKQMHRRLQIAGINTVEQLYRASKLKLRRVWGGIEGERMYERLRGELVSLPPTHKQVVGHSHVLPPHLRSHDGAYSVLQRLIQKAAVRLRSYGYKASGVYAKVKYLSGERWDGATTFQPTTDTHVFVDVLARQWRDAPVRIARPVAVAVTLFNLVKIESSTEPLFPDVEGAPQLSTAIDRINNKFGRHTVYFAGAHHALSHGAAPMRIAFTHIPDIETEGDV
ncbi:MAG: DNA polymerase [Candidatus Kapabacteria bacterium]|nr:DNA polymerase [Candidatus Kapabacteria bacterium]